MAYSDNFLLVEFTQIITTKETLLGNPLFLKKHLGRLLIFAQKILKSIHNQIQTFPGEPHSSLPLFAWTFQHLS